VLLPRDPPAGPKLVSRASRLAMVGPSSGPGRDRTRWAPSPTAAGPAGRPKAR